MFELQRFGGRAVSLPQGLIKNLLQYLLSALDFLHREAGIVHCDIKLSNIMLEIEDTTVLPAFEDEEKRNPSQRKVVDEERSIYVSRKLKHPSAHAFGLPVLCDFGESRIGDSFPYEEISPEVYKAPEILLQLDWNSSVDIWTIACVTWDMIQVEHLFDGYDEEGYHNNRVHLGEMVGLLGLPPLDFQARSTNSWRVFDERGNWRGAPPLSPDSLEDKLTTVGGDKSEFLDFVRCMLEWKPEARHSAKRLLEHPWLRSS